MRTKFKKILIISSAIALSLGVLNINFVSAKDIDAIYEEEISKSIIYGDGSAENPYVLNEETSPMFTQYLKDKGREALGNVIYPDNGISTFGILDGVLSGTSHYNQQSGGYWNFGKNAPNVGANGSIWMQSVDYIGYDMVIKMCAEFQSASLVSRFKDCINSLAGKGLEKGINYLVSQGFSFPGATALAQWAGCGSTYIMAYLLMSEYSSFIRQKPYLNARDAKKGLIHAVYKTSYQGQWYNQTLSETWGSYPVAKEPMSYCGIGTYRSR